MLRPDRIISNLSAQPTITLTETDPKLAIVTNASYIKPMNRRRFIQSLAAVFSLPAAPTLSLGSATAAVPTAAAVPAQARFWSIYMTALHGECTPQTLQNLLHIPEVDAKRYVGQLIADGVIKPNPLLQNTVSELVKPNDESLIDKVKKRFDKSKQSKTERLDVVDTAETPENLDDKTEWIEDISEDDLDGFPNEASDETKRQQPDVDEAQS